MAVLDLATLALTFSNDAVKMRKYTQLFLDTARDGIAEMEQAMALEDLGRLADLGHRSKSSALAVGAHAFASLCVSIEGLRLGGDLQQARALLTALGPALAQVADKFQWNLPSATPPDAGSGDNMPLTSPATLPETRQPIGSACILPSRPAFSSCMATSWNSCAPPSSSGCASIRWHRWKRTSFWCSRTAWPNG